MAEQSALAEHIALAVDIGGSKAEIAVIDATGAARVPACKHPVPFSPSGAADPAALVEILAPAVDALRATPGAVAGIGLSVCGNIAADSGEGVLVPNLHWRNVPFGRMVVERFGLPIFPATDVRQATLAEALWGAAQGARFFAWCTIGTGYGGYFLLDGRLYHGVHGFAGPFGHSTVDEVNGYPCGCGRRGCVETYVAGPAIARAGQQLADSGDSPALRALAADGPVTTAHVFAAAAQGDPASQAVLDGVIRRVAISLASLVNTLDLELIVVGGSVAHAAPDFVPRIGARMLNFFMSEEAKRDFRLVRESLPNSALYGAAADAFVRSGVLALPD